MKRASLIRNSVPGLLASALVAFGVLAASGQSAVDEIEVVRGVLKADRKIVIAEGMKLTEEEGSAFWPIYRRYRAEMDEIGDSRVELVLEYADLYPDLPEARAKAMLKKNAALETKATALRNKYLKQFGKILPASKVLRFAQLENRFDLAIRVQIAAAIPVVPADTKRNQPPLGTANSDAN